MSLTQRLVEYVSACFTGIWIQSAEHEDALREIAEMCRDRDWRLTTWDVDRGLQIPGAEQTADAGGNDPVRGLVAKGVLAFVGHGHPRRSRPRAPDPPDDRSRASCRLRPRIVNNRRAGWLAASLPVGAIPSQRSSGRTKARSSPPQK